MIENDVSNLKEGNVTEYFDRLDKFFADLSKEKSNEEQEDQPDKEQSASLPSSDSSNEKSEEQLVKE